MTYSAPEKAFKNKIMPKLRKIPKSYWFVKEAVALVGIPDIIGCINGRLITLELKRNIFETKKDTGRIVRQRREGHRIVSAGGYFAIACPENFEEIYKELLLLAKD